MEYRLANDNEDWPSYLPLVLDYYNNQHKHRTNTFKVGDYVFILTDKDRFAKGDIGNIGLYRVTNVNGYKVNLEQILPDGTSIHLKLK